MPREWHKRIKAWAPYSIRHYALEARACKHVVQFANAMQTIKSMPEVHSARFGVEFLCGQMGETWKSGIPS
jgi:hypothetical protein